MIIWEIAAATVVCFAAIAALVRAMRNPRPPDYQTGRWRVATGWAVLVTIGAAGGAELGGASTATIGLIVVIGVVVALVLAEMWTLALSNRWKR